MVRTRIAPSPTGIPHIGTIRTALFSFLYAKKCSGQFILRIEDTDQKRLVPGVLEKIYQTFDFLGLTPDEGPQQGGQYGPYIQTQRLDIYQKYTQKLLESAHAYESEGAIRIKMPKTGFTNWKDLIQGKISYPNKEIDDKVLMKSNGIPTYHLAVVIDDHLMKISHVLRGVEWISSTPVHLQLYQALGWQPPLFGHVPIVLGEDKSKLSKRHGAKSALDYRDDGYLPEALISFLAYLGWSYQDNSQLLNISELIQAFDINKIQKSNAVFDIQKLNYFNGKAIRAKSDQQLLSLVKPFLQYPAGDELLLKIIPLIKERITALKDTNSLISFFFNTPQIPAELVNYQQYLADIESVLTKVTWEKTAIETALLKIIDEKNHHKGDFFMGLRLAVCGQRITPPLTESMLILGKDEVVSRIHHAHTTL